MKEKNSFFNTVKGLISGLLIFAAFVGFCMFMFWVCMKLTGTTL